MARNDIRPIIKLKSTAGTGYTYVTRKNRRNNPDRIVLKKFDPVVRKHVEFRDRAQRAAQGQGRPVRRAPRRAQGNHQEPGDHGRGPSRGPDRSQQDVA